VRFAPDGKTLAWGGSKRSLPADRSIRLVSTATWKETGRLDAQEGGIAFLAFSRDGARLAAGGLDNTVLTWELAPARIPNSK